MRVTDAPHPDCDILSNFGYLSNLGSSSCTTLVQKLSSTSGQIFGVATLGDDFVFNSSNEFLATLRRVISLFFEVSSRPVPSTMFCLPDLAAWVICSRFLLPSGSLKNLLRNSELRSKMSMA